jgi:hypothetical protein
MILTHRILVGNLKSSTRLLSKHVQIFCYFIRQRNEFLIEYMVYFYGSLCWSFFLAWKITDSSLSRSFNVISLFVLHKFTLQNVHTEHLPCTHRTCTCFRYGHLVDAPGQLHTPSREP